MSSSSTKGSFFVLFVLRNSAAHAEHSDITPASQMAPSQPTGPAPTADKTAAPRAASPGGTVPIPVAFLAAPTDTQPPAGQEKQPAPSQAAGVAAQPAIVETPAAATTYQAPASAPTSSEKPPLPPSDSTPAPLDTKLDPDADDDIDEDGDPADPVDPALTMTGPAGSFPRVPDEGLRRRRARLMIIHTRLAKFFTWILLLGFVILPGTFNHDAKIKDVPLYVLSFLFHLSFAKRICSCLKFFFFPNGCY